MTGQHIRRERRSAEKRAAYAQIFAKSHERLALMRFNNRNHILAAIRAGRVELAIARKNALAGENGAWEDVSRIESEIENLTEFLNDIYL